MSLRFWNDAMVGQTKGIQFVYPTCEDCGEFACQRPQNPKKMRKKQAQVSTKGQGCEFNRSSSLISIYIRSFLLSLLKIRAHPAFIAMSYLVSFTWRTCEDKIQRLFNRAYRRKMQVKIGPKGRIFWQNISNWISQIEYLNLLLIFEGVPRTRSWESIAPGLMNNGTLLFANV